MPDPTLADWQAYLRIYSPPDGNYLLLHYLGASLHSEDRAALVRASEVAVWLGKTPDAARLRAMLRERFGELDGLRTLAALRDWLVKENHCPTMEATEALSLPSLLSVLRQAQAPGTDQAVQQAFSAWRRKRKKERARQRLQSELELAAK